ncbi:MAG TPA: [protein-PII] uridylyltransferase [Acidimicrobiales bacterium]|nr:[protein-PII] uridylyltransferase [Acidimicrobiales bacterium]
MTGAGAADPFADCRARAVKTDAWLRELLGDEPDVALVAVGGYGRYELCPHSDLDVVLLHAGRKDIAAIADRIWYPIWDAGVALDHSVRTLKDAVAVAAKDLRTVLGLMDARLIAGDAALASELTGRVAELWRTRGSVFLPELAEQVEARHERAGPVAFLLEPDVKEGHGGLRDVQVLRAVMQAVTVVPPLGEDVFVAYGDLLSARIALHKRSGRANDRLLLEDQDGVADDLGYADADALMAAIATAGRAIAWRSDDAWARVGSALQGPRGRTAGRDRIIGPALVERDSEVVITADADLAADPSIPLRVGAASARLGAPINRQTLRRITSEAVEPPAPWPASVRDALVALLGTGGRAISALEALDQHGALVRLLPEWQAVRNKPQRNAYHRFTVDRHLCEAAANAAEMVRRVERPDLLLVGALLHDIGKGFPGDHTEVGIDLVDRIGRRMGFADADVATLVAMVRHHLLLPDVATRRDLEDPATIEAVAAAVGDRVTLELLAALTEADSKATGATAWSDWKAGLIAELVARVREVLAGHPLPPPAVPTDRHRALMAEGETVVEVEPSQVTVVARDAPGLLSRVAGGLAVIGLDVRAAVAGGEEGMAVEVLDVVPRFGESPPPDRLRGHLLDAIEGRLPIEQRLAERASNYGGVRRPRAARPTPPVVLFDDGASERATVIEVRAPDGIGVLYRVTRALAGCGVDIRSAKVSTLGHEVVDAFYVTEVDGSKVVAGEHRRAIETAVLAALGSG